MNNRLLSASCAREVAVNTEGAVPTELLVLPAGRIDGRDGRWWTNSDPDQIVADFEAQGVDLPIDYEHAMDLAPTMGQAVPAAGWITGVEVREGAIWATVNWTPSAIEMIESREYRYFSPTFYYDDDPDHTIVGLSSIALTNQPNLRQAALNKRQANPTNSDIKEPAMDKAARKTLCTRLGLAEEASDTSIQEAVDKALASARTPPLENFVPRADHDKVKGDLEKAQASLKKHADEAVATLVDEAVTAGKISPASKDYHLAACQTEAGVEAFKKLVGDLPANAVTEKSDLEGKQPPNAGGTLTADEKAMCARMGVAEEAFIKERARQKAS